LNRREPAAAIRSRPERAKTQYSSAAGALAKYCHGKFPSLKGASLAPSPRISRDFVVGRLPAGIDGISCGRPRNALALFAVPMRVIPELIALQRN